jgi:hypothetical protein
MILTYLLRHAQAEQEALLKPMILSASFDKPFGRAECQRNPSLRRRFVDGFRSTPPPASEFGHRRPQQIDHTRRARRL